MTGCSSLLIIQDERAKKVRKTMRMRVEPRKLAKKAVTVRARAQKLETAKRKENAFESGCDAIECMERRCSVEQIVNESAPLRRKLHGDEVGVLDDGREEQGASKLFGKSSVPEPLLFFAVQAPFVNRIERFSVIPARAHASTPKAKAGQIFYRPFPPLNLIISYNLPTAAFVLITLLSFQPRSFPLTDLLLQAHCLTHFQHVNVCLYRPGPFVCRHLRICHPLNMLNCADYALPARSEEGEISGVI